jgi:hypothetical protein
MSRKGRFAASGRARRAPSNGASGRVDVSDRFPRRSCWRSRHRMQPEKCGPGIAGARFDRAGVRSLGDAEQLADHQIAPEESGELPGEVRRAAVDQSGRARLGHDVAQGGAARLMPHRIERPRHLRRLDRLGDRQAEDRHDVGIADLRARPASRTPSAPAPARRGRAASACRPPAAVAGRVPRWPRSASSVWCRSPQCTFAASIRFHSAATAGRPPTHVTPMSAAERRRSASCAP